MNIREVLLKRGVKWRDAANAEIALCCPFCLDRGESQDERFRFYLNLKTGQAYCFNCGFKAKHGIALLARKLRIEGSLTLEHLPEELPKAPPALPSDFQCLSHRHSDLDRRAFRYLQQRGITEKQIRSKRIGVSFVGRLAYRIIFPVWDGGTLLGVVARDFTNNQEPRYLNSFGEKSLYNLPSRETPRVILSEGVFKACRIERLQTGFRSLALLGKAITESQVDQLKKLKCREIVIWPDPDKPGRTGAAEVGAKLVQAGFLVGIVWPVYQPADEQPLEEMKETWKSVQGYSWSLQQRLSFAA